MAAPCADRTAGPRDHRTALDGSSIDLAAYRGHPVIVNFWASWCVPCREEFRCSRRLEQLGPPTAWSCSASCTRTRPSPRSSSSTSSARRAHGHRPRRRDRQAYRVVAPPQTYFIDAEGPAGIRSARCCPGLRHPVREDQAVTGAAAPAVVGAGRDHRRRPAGHPPRPRPRDRRRRAAQGLRGREILGGSRSTCGAASCSRCWAERRGQDDDGRDHRGLPGARRRQHGCSASTRPATAGASAPIGLMLRTAGSITGRRRARSSISTRGSAATPRTPTGCSTRSTSGRQDPLPAPVRRRSSARARPGAAGPTGAAGPRRAAAGHGRRQAGDPRADRRPAGDGHHDPADDASWATSSGWPTGSPSSTTGAGCAGHAGRAHGRRRAAPACACRARSRTARRPTSPRSSRVTGGRPSSRRRGATARAYDVADWTGAGRATRRGGGGLVRVRDLLLVELRTGAASLEERYLELVRSGRARRARDGR